MYCDVLGLNYELLNYDLTSFYSEPPIPVLCAVKDCKNIKKYNCSKTNVPLCSLKCYKANLASSNITNPVVSAPITA